MHVFRLNRPLFEFPESHPAHQFLSAFIRCRVECVGRDACDEPIDQEWFSASELRQRSFSDFAYAHLSFDIVLDGWLSNAQELTESEKQWLDQLPRFRVLLEECKSAAIEDGNSRILPLVQQVKDMLEDRKSVV